MSLADEKLSVIKAQIKQGVVPQQETIRIFLQWFQAARRGFNVVRHIRQRLKHHGIVTVPDFEYEYIDSSISFALAPTDESSASEEVDRSVADPTHRLGRLDSANKPPVFVAPDAALKTAVALMMTNDYSQLPVMTSPRDVKGVISWKAIGNRLVLKRPCINVRDCMEPAEIVSIDASLFGTISKVAEHDYVLVQANDKVICGIVTAADFNDQFRRLAEPFLLVGEIENGLRRILRGKFTSKELEAARAPGDDERIIAGISDLTFGEYIRLIEPEKHWKKLALEVDRVVFLAKLNRIRDVRNDVTHFDPDGLEPADLVALREFARFLRMLRDVGAV